jgi:hypothetical protein
MRGCLHLFFFVAEVFLFLGAVSSARFRMCAATAGDYLCMCILL